VRKRGVKREMRGEGSLILCEEIRLSFILDKIDCITLDDDDRRYLYISSS
jgi:hypothetical protein